MQEILTNYGRTIFFNRYGIDHYGSSALQEINFINEKEISGLDIKGYLINTTDRIPLFVEPDKFDDYNTILWFFQNSHNRYPFVTENGNNITIGLNLFNQIGQFISGFLDNKIKNLGAYKRSFVSSPHADYYCDLLFDVFIRLNRKKNEPTICKSMWPLGKQFAVCLTHDVDEIRKTYQWVTFPARYLSKLDFNKLFGQIKSMKEKIAGHEPFWTFNELIQLEDTLNVKSSFYFLNESSQFILSNPKSWRHSGRRYEFNDNKIKSVFKYLKMHGWEIGLHGSFDSYKNEGKLIAEKRYLESVIGKEVIGTRQHNLNLNLPDTWLFQERAGLKYDTTLGFNDAIGFRWGVCYPFYPLDSLSGRTLDILEIPLIIEDLPFFRFKDKSANFFDIMDKIIRVNGVMTLLWHHSVFNKNEFPGWGDAYTKIIQYCMQHGGWITSGERIYEWIKQRNELKIEYTPGPGSISIRLNPAGVHNYLDIYLPGNLQITKLHNAKILRSDASKITLETDPMDTEDCITIEFSEI